MYACNGFPLCPAESLTEHEFPYIAPRCARILPFPSVAKHTSSLDATSSNYNVLLPPNPMPILPPLCFVPSVTVVTTSGGNTSKSPHLLMMATFVHGSQRHRTHCEEAVGIDRLWNCVVSASFSTRGRTTIWHGAAIINSLACPRRTMRGNDIKATALFSYQAGRRLNT